MTNNRLKISFAEPIFSVKGNTVICKQAYWYAAASHVIYEVKAIAVCKPEDEFDINIGKKISKTKAEIKAWRDIMAKEKRVLKTVTKAGNTIMNTIDAMGKFIQHNVEYLKSIADYEHEDMY